MLATAIWHRAKKRQAKSALYALLQKRDAPFTLQNAALRNKFVALRGFAIPLPPFRAFPPYFTFPPPGLKARRFFLAPDTGQLRIG
jgi:hypothetical protein